MTLTKNHHRQHKFLLDTNICAALINQPNGKVAKRLFHEGSHHACINWVVQAELQFGARKKGTAELQHRVDALINELDMIEFTPSLIEHYVSIRCELTAQGTPIGQSDLWIASHARALDLCVVTHNLHEFKRVNGLTVVDWL